MGYATVPKLEQSKVPGHLEVIGVGGDRILIQGEGLPSTDISAPVHFESLEDCLAAAQPAAEESKVEAAAEESQAEVEAEAAGSVEAPEGEQQPKAE